MNRVALALLLLLAGCHQVVDLAPTDAAPPFPDADRTIDAGYFPDGGFSPDAGFFPDGAAETPDASL